MAVSATIAALALTTFAGCSSSASEAATDQVIVEPLTEYVSAKDELAIIRDIRANRAADKPLYEIYDALTLIDIHNHDAANPSAIERWGQYGIDRIVLFGNISEPSAQTTDQLAWEQYVSEPSRVYPSFAGFPIYEEEGPAIVKSKLEQGYLNIGEIVAASTYSPVASKVVWKAEHPNDGHFREIYDLAAEYKTPILLHIDPPNGEPIAQLEKALDEHPDTKIILGHGNAYVSPDSLEGLIAKHPNLYIDFFAGFTAYNGESANVLQDFVPLMESYPDRFMLSTDSGYGLDTEQAAKALYEMIDLLTPETAVKVASRNYESIVELEPPTASQIEKIRLLSASLGKFETYRLNRRTANELIFELDAENAAE